MSGHVRSSVLGLWTTIVLSGQAGHGVVLPTERRIAYPHIEADNLLGEVIVFPAWLFGHTTLILVAWAQEQQREVNTWLALLPLLETEAALRVIETPIVRPQYRSIKRRMDGWMRDGIPTEAGRARTITLYAAPREFAASLGIRDRSVAAAVLVDDEGRIAKAWFGPATGLTARDVIASVGRL